MTRFTSYSPTRRIGAILVLAYTLAAIMVLTTGCGGSSDSPTAPRATASGQWTGALHEFNGTSYPVTMGLVETSGTVTGSATIIVDGTSYVESVSGTYFPPNITLVFHDPQTQDASFTGTITGNTMTGTLQGSGFTGESLTLTRQ